MQISERLNLVAVLFRHARQQQISEPIMDIFRLS